MVLKKLLVSLTLYSLFESLQASAKPITSCKGLNIFIVDTILEPSFTSNRKVMAGKVRKPLYLEAFQK